MYIINTTKTKSRSKLYDLSAVMYCCETLALRDLHVSCTVLTAVYSVGVVWSMHAGFCCM